MSPKKLITGLLLALVAVSIVAFVARQAGWVSSETLPLFSSSDVPRHKIIAYYVHGNVRCPTCINIEQFTDEALKTYFADDLNQGRLEWHVINREVPPNEHFVQDYQLYSQALILIDSIPGQPAESKNLEAIWDHAHDKRAFMEYVRGEVDQYLSRL